MMIWIYAEQEKIDEETFKEKLNKLDQHLKLYNFLTLDKGRNVEVIKEPTTFVKDILYGFRNVKGGLHGIVTEPWHYSKVPYTTKILKLKGKISKDLEFISIPSEDTSYYSIPRKALSHLKTISELVLI